METERDITLPMIQLIGIINTSISLGYIWLNLNLKLLDSHIKFLLVLLGLQNLSLLLISVISASVILINPNLDKDICLWAYRPIFVAFNGNIVLTSLISATRYWKAYAHQEKIASQVVNFMFVKLFMNTAFIHIGYHTLFFTSLNQDICAVDDDKVEIYTDGGTVLMIVASYGTFWSIFWIYWDICMLKFHKKMNKIRQRKKQPKKNITTEDSLIVPVYATIVSLCTLFMVFMAGPLLAINFSTVWDWRVENKIILSQSKKSNMELLSSTWIACNLPSLLFAVKDQNKMSQTQSSIVMQEIGNTNRTVPTVPQAPTVQKDLEDTGPALHSKGLIRKKSAIQNQPHVHVALVHEPQPSTDLHLQDLDIIESIEGNDKKSEPEPEILEKEMCTGSKKIKLQ